MVNDLYLGLLNLHYIFSIFISNLNVKLNIVIHMFQLQFQLSSDQLIRQYLGRQQYPLHLELIFSSELSNDSALGPL